MLLSKEEREKFAGWCRERARENRGLVEQMAKISVPQQLGDKLSSEASAYEVVASILESITEETI